MMLMIQVSSTLPQLTTRSDTVGVFIPSIEENNIERCLDRQYSIDVSELAASILHYPHSVRSAATSVSNLGL